MLKTYFLDAKKRLLSPLLLDPLRFLDGLYTNIGCQVVECVPLTTTLLAWVDEEISTPSTFGAIVGNVVITGPTDEDGDVTDVQVSIELVARLLGVDHV